MTKAIHNLQVNSIAYSDVQISNNPALRAWDLTFKLAGIPIVKPTSQSLWIAPEQSQVLFDGTRSTSIDNTTTVTVSQPNPSDSFLYRVTHSGGTDPEFRDLRPTLIDNTTVFTFTVNGPMITMTRTAGTIPNFASVLIGDILRIDDGSGVSSSNQGQFTVASKTANSLTYQNPNGAAEVATVSDPLKLIAYSNGGASNQLQIGDTVQLGSTFSVASQDSYEVVDVAPDFFDIRVAAPNGIPLEEDIDATGLTFYSSAKNFIMIAAQQNCVVKLNGSTDLTNLLNPIENGNPEKPALFLKTGLVYKLEIVNQSLETLSVTVVSAE